MILRNLSLSLSLRRGPPRLWSWLRGSDSLKLASEKLIHLRSEQQQVDKKLWGCFLALRRCWRKRRGLGHARLPCLFYSSLLQGLLHCHLWWWTVEMMTKMTHPHFKRKCLLFKLFIRFHIFYKFIISINISFLLVKVDCLGPPSPF